MTQITANKYVFVEKKIFNTEIRCEKKTYSEQKLKTNLQKIVIAKPREIKIKCRFTHKQALTSSAP